MIRARRTGLLAVLLLALAACGQKGDLKLPAAKTQPGQAQPTPAQPAPSAAPTPPTRSTK
jgi:predicted small lipoprotein YifL